VKAQSRSGWIRDICMATRVEVLAVWFMVFLSDVRIIVAKEVYAHRSPY